MCRSKDLGFALPEGSIFYFIGNSDFGDNKNKRMFIEHTLDNETFGHKKQMRILVI